MKKYFDFLKRHLLEVQLLLWITLGCIYWCYWHFKPFTPNAFVFAYTRPVSSFTDGFITDIYVKNNQFVKKGQTLFTVFKEPYKLKIEELENEIAARCAELKSQEAAVKRNLSEQKQAQARLKNDQYLYTQADNMLKSSAVAGEYAEERLRAMQESQAQLEALKYAGEEIRHRCSMIEAQIKKLTASLELNKIWYALTDVKAFADGYITNLTITPGGYYRAGEVLCGFVDTSCWYVQANIKESELSAIRPGVKARIWLWQHPGKVYNGIVEYTGYAAERRKMSAQTGLTEVEKENEWFLLPQRFPVQIKIVDYAESDKFTHGASAYVELDIPSRPIRQFFWEIFLWD
ncbi:MAG: HlyD family secretion protein [Lentisphaerae bacterium]|nr:HlyD family secretion protein [Lentisphaerota bacterium]